MKIKKYFLNLSVAVLLGALTVVTQLVHAATPSVSDPASLEDMQQILRLTTIDRLVHKYMRIDAENESSKKPESALDVDVFLAPFTLDLLNEKMAEIYRNHLSQTYAKKLLQDMQTPAAKLSNRMFLAEINSSEAGLQQEYRKLKPQERDMLNAYRRSVNYTSLVNARDKSRAEVNQMIKTWIREETQARVLQARKTIADLVMAEVNAEKADQELSEAALQQRIAPTGMRSVDQIFLVTFDLIRKRIRLQKTFAKQYDQLEIANILKPENLVTREKLEAGNLVILSAENLFDEEVKKNDQLLEEHKRNMQKIPMSAAQRQAQNEVDDIQNAQLFDLQIRVNEQIRIMLEVKKRILAFCEQKLGKVVLENGKLMFHDNEDVAAYNALVQQIAPIADKVQSLEKEDQERRSKVAGRMRKL